MIAVSDTSPISYLVLIGEADLLPALFQEVVIPPAVAAELSDSAGPEFLVDWGTKPPPWLRIVGPPKAGASPRLSRLHRGEVEAIELAQHLLADVVLLDEKNARRAAQSLSLPVMGVVGILAEAARQRLIDPVSAITRLSQTNFRASPELLRRILSPE